MPNATITITGNPLPGILDKWPHMVDIGDMIDAVVEELDDRNNEAAQDNRLDFNAVREPPGREDTGDAFLPADLIELIEKGPSATARGGRLQIKTVA